MRGVVRGGVRGVVRGGYLSILMRAMALFASSTALDGSSWTPLE